MKTPYFLKSTIYLMFALGINYQSLANNNIPTTEQQQLLNNNKSKVSFQENKGQVHDQNYQARPDVLFSGQTNGMVFHLKNKGISYQLTRIDSYKDVEDERTGETRKEIAQSTIYRIDINWLNTNTNSTVHKSEALEGFNNYYLEHCPDGALNVLSYENITYQNIYNGIDLKWYSKDGALKYDYLVAAGADYQQIQFEIKGAESITINKNGELEIKTPLGTIIEEAPYVVQNGRALKSQWVVVNNTIRFHIEEIDPTKPFIIDPAIRTWGTYYGGTGNDYGNSCAMDGSGNVYTAGWTGTTTGTVMATTGSHQSTHGGGGNDAFLAKFNSSGVRQWGTYYGGAGNDDYGVSCTVDGSGNVYLAGQTNTTTGTSIATIGSHQSTYGGGIDAFLVKFNSSGIRQWGTYYGGIGDEIGYSCVVDVSENVYLVGYSSTATGTSIATSGSHQSTYGGSNDAFLVKFNSSGVRQWGTYYGGAGTDIGLSAAMDASGSVYLVGHTASATGTIIATSGSHQSTYGGSNDAFLVQFNSSGVRQWGTYYGGTGTDIGYSSTVDASGNVYLVGYTATITATVIATSGSHQSTNGGGSDDAFLVQFNSSGTRQWGTYYGGIGSDRGYFCDVDASGNVYLTGLTSTTTGTSIATTGSHQSIHGGINDAYLAQFNSSGVRQWGTYYGGTGSDIGWSCVIDASDNIYLAGQTSTTTGTSIATAGSHQDTHGGGTNDAFLVQFVGCSSSPSPPSSITGNATVCSGTAQTYSVTNDPSATSYIWTLPGGWSGTSTTNSINATAGASGGTITVTANNACGSSTAQTLTITVNTVPVTPSLITGNDTVCSGTSQPYSVTNDPSATSYTWSLPATWSGTSTTNSISSTAGTSGGTITVTATNACGTSAVSTLSITVNSAPATPSVISGTTNFCEDATAQTYSVTNDPSASSYTWTLPGSWSGTSATNSINATAGAIGGTISVTANNSCGSSTVQSLNVTVNPLPTVIASGTATICDGESTNLSANGASTYSWDNGAGTGATVSVSPSTTTTYTVTGTDGNTCVNTAQVTVTVNPLPDTSITEITNQLTAVQTGANYQWLNCPLMSVIAGATNQVYNVTTSGNYAVAVTLNGCTDTSSCRDVVFVGITELFSMGDVRIYPNPSNGIINVEVLNLKEEISFIITDIAGRKITEFTSKQPLIHINLSEEGKGVYFLQIQTENNQLVKKIIVQ